MIPQRIRRQFGNSIQIQPQAQIESQGTTSGLIPPRIRRQFGNSNQIQPQAQTESLVSLTKFTPSIFSNHKIKLNPWSNHIRSNSIKYFSYHKFFQGVIHSLKVQSNSLENYKRLDPQNGVCRQSRVPWMQL